MAGRDTAPRRYAEAAFEVAMRDGTVETWRADLGPGRDRRGRSGRRAGPREPGRPVRDTPAPRSRAPFGNAVSAPAMNLIGLLLRRGRIEQLPRVAAEFRRLDNARQGITIATATSAVAARSRTRSGP